jgi:hypothetical protein
LGGRGKNLESILLISLVADLSDPVSPPLGAGMQLTTPSQNAGISMGMGYSLICLRSPDPTESLKPEFWTQSPNS